MEKKRLIFDLPLEEYEEFIEEVEKAGQTKIGYFREILDFHRASPFSNRKINEDASSATIYREQYITLAISAIGYLAHFNTGKSLGTKPVEQQWNTWVERLAEIVEHLKSAPLDLPDDKFEPQSAPTWLMIVSDFLIKKLYTKEGR